MRIAVAREKIVKIILASLVAPLLALISTPSFAPAANATPTAAVLTSDSMELTPISWNIVGLDSNNVNVGPNRFPVGVKVCNKTSSEKVPTFEWNWGAGDSTALNILGPASYTDTMTAAAGARPCVYAFWTVEVKRASASYLKTRNFWISATLGSEVVNTNPNIALKVEKLVSQARNDVTGLTVSNSLSNVGETATVTLNGVTSTAYEQLTVWPVLDLSLVRIRSMNFTFSNDSSTRAGIDSPLSQIYADACGWNPLTNACIGTGKVGGTSVVTMVLERVAAGNFSMAGVIYDLSGSSYHYNSDYGSAGTTLTNAAVTGSNANIAEDDLYFTDFNQTLNGSTVGTNDTLVPTVIYETVTAVTSGTLSLNSSTGTFTYTPTTNFSGSVEFTYRVCTDAGGGNKTGCSSPATVTIYVGVQAIDDDFLIGYQESLTVGTSVKVNDFYSSTTTKWETTTVITIPSGGAAGTLTFLDDGTFSYLSPTGYSGTASFSYRICKPDCVTPTDSSTALVTIYIGPLAVNDSYTATSGQTITKSLDLNDKKPTDATYQLVSTTSANGTVTLNTSTGQMTYRSTSGFTGTATFTYKVCDSQDQCSTATVTITVNAAAPSGGASIVAVNPLITWPTPAAIYYPTPLGSVQLNAVATYNGVQVPGTYSYQYPSGTILTPGSYPMLVTFTPTDRVTYNSVSTTVIQLVLRPQPTITWPNPSPQVGPYTLSPTQLNAICSVPGTLTYDPVNATVLQPGSYTLKVTCTPTDPNYAPITAEVPFTVTRPLPTITWNDPTPVAGPYTLSPNILNAICSQPGTLTYDPVAGGIYQPGTYTLRVTCLPTNTLYGPISTTVTLRVVPPVTITIPLQVIPGVVTTPLDIPATISNLNPVITSLCNGISGAIITGSQFAYTPVNTFSGRTCINVRVLINGVLQNVQVPILVNPVAPDAIKQPVTFMTGLISWSSSPNAIGYKVEIRGKLICTTSELSCNAPQTVGPATPVLVTALGNDETSTTVEAKYKVKKVLAFTVYFDIAKFNLKPAASKELNRVSAIILREGFTNIQVIGHTDSSKYDNQTLSKNRAKTSLARVLSKVPNLVVRTKAEAERVPAASNKTVKGKTLNRRAEGFVY